MFSHRYRYFFIAGLSLYTFINTLLCEVYYYFKIETEWYFALATLLLVTTAIWETGRFLQPLFHRKINASANKIKWLLIFFAVSCLPAFLLTAGIVFFMSILVHGYSFEQSLIPLKLNFIYAGLANLLFHLLHAIMFYFKEYKTKWVETEALKQVTAQAELQLVKSQVNPHFLFNNLNVLSSLVLQNNAEANKFIEAFSQVYRYILTTHENELIEVETELKQLKPYIYLLEKRFGEGINIQIDLSSACNRFYVIPASLQMLIENAIKHNVVSRQRPLQISIRQEESDLVVENNLQPRAPAEKSLLVGLANIKKRYELVSSRQVAIEASAPYFKVTLPLLTLN
ncbi:MAG: hypothetical protein EOO06_14920 [Chitinophagaceae bacterium]|nr:MAG: hypothetical protein EOO06_14920 [Chitinophagaceae bacterium]